MYLEPCQTSKIECLTKNVNRFKPLTIFSKQPILDVWQGSGYASGSLKLFYRGFKRDSNKRLTRVKEKQSIIKLGVFVLSFNFFAPMYQIKSFINRSTCYFLHA